jgi:hypothetical protein
VRCDRGTGRFTTSESPLRRVVIERCSRASCLTAFKTRAWAFSSHGVDATEPLTLLSRSSRSTPTPHPPSGMLHADRTSFFWKVSYGSEDAKTAETTVDAPS